MRLVGLLVLFACFWDEVNISQGFNELRPNFDGDPTFAKGFVGQIGDLLELDVPDHGLHGLAWVVVLPGAGDGVGDGDGVFLSLIHI